MLSVQLNQVNLNLMVELYKTLIVVTAKQNWSNSEWGVGKEGWICLTIHFLSKFWHAVSTALS